MTVIIPMYVYTLHSISENHVENGQFVNNVMNRITCEHHIILFNSNYILNYHYMCILFTCIIVNI